MRFESVLPFNSVFDLMFEIIDVSLLLTTSVSAVEERVSHFENPKSIASAAMFYSMFLVRNEFVDDQGL